MIKLHKSLGLEKPQLSRSRSIKGHYLSEKKGESIYCHLEIDLIDITERFHV